MTGDPPATPGGPAADAGAPLVRRGRAKSVVGFVLGVFLLGLAAWVVHDQRGAFRNARDAVGEAPGWQLGLVLVLPVVNLVFASLTFWTLTRRYGRVPFGEMLGLIGSAWLLNHLPLRPGLVGRVAYHKAVHGIAVRDSMKVLASALGCTAVALAILGLTTLALARAASESAWGVAFLGVPVLALGVAAVALRALDSGEGGAPSQAWRWPAAVAFRYLDMLTWTARYALLFAVLVRPLTPTGASAVTVFGQLAGVAPVQVGLREWLVGVGAAVLPAEAGAPASQGDALDRLAPGLLVDMVNRVSELAWALPVGTVATAVLYRRWRRVRGARSATPCERIPTPG